MSDDVTMTCDPAPVSEALHAAGPIIAKQTDQVDEDSAYRVGADVRKRLPRRTGDTIGSIEIVKATRKGGYVLIIRGAARYLEFGTKFMQARRFLFPAVDLEASGYRRRTRDAIQDSIDHVGLGS